MQGFRAQQVHLQRALVECWPLDRVKDDTGWLMDLMVVLQCQIVLLGVMLVLLGL